MDMPQLNSSGWNLIHTDKMRSLDNIERTRLPCLEEKAEDQKTKKKMMCIDLVYESSGHKYTVKLLIIGDDLFAKISRRQITISQFLYSSVGNRQLILCQIVIAEKPPNIATKYSRFTVTIF